MMEEKATAETTRPTIGNDHPSKPSLFPIAPGAE